MSKVQIPPLIQPLLNLKTMYQTIDRLFEMINQEFKAQGTKKQVLPNFGIRCRELGGLKVTIFRACVRSFDSVLQNIIRL